MPELKHTFKTDILFKLLFTKHPDLLKHLIAQLLKLQYNKISKFEIRNPEMPPDSIGNKFCRLDILMTVNNQQVNLEVQVENEKAYPERSLFNWARAYSNALPAGDNYSLLPRTVLINIIDFTLFKDSKEFHSEFQPLEVTRKSPLTDKMVLHYFELKKLPNKLSKDDMLHLWLMLFKANTEEELKNIDRLGVPEMSEAITAYNNITKSAEFREIERLRIKASHDEAQALYNAELKGERKGKRKGKREGELKTKQEIAKTLVSLGDPIDKIITATGLTKEEIEGLTDTHQ